MRTFIALLLTAIGLTAATPKIKLNMTGPFGNSYTKDIDAPAGTVLFFDANGNPTNTTITTTTSAT